MANGDWGVEISGGYFDDKHHQYRNTKGTIVPSTTQVFDILHLSDFNKQAESVVKVARTHRLSQAAIDDLLSALGLSEFKGRQDDLEWKREYGIATHKAVELLVQQDLDWDSLDEAIIPAVSGLEQKLKALQFKYEAAEERRIHTLFGMEYGLTTDLRGTIVHQGKERKAVIDLKSGVKFSPTWRWQVGGYTSAQGKVDGGWMGVILQFDKEGIVHPHYIDLVPAQREFQILLSAAILKLNAGLAKIGKAA